MKSLVPAGSTRLGSWKRKLVARSAHLAAAGAAVAHATIDHALVAAARLRLAPHAPESIA
jgi:NAD(P)H-dependent FMN reductase